MFVEVTPADDDRLLERDPPFSFPDNSLIGDLPDRIFVDGEVINAVNEYPAGLPDSNVVQCAVNQGSYLNGTGLVGTEGLVGQAVHQADAWRNYGTLSDVDRIGIGLSTSDIVPDTGEDGTGFAVEAFLHKGQLYVLISDRRGGARSDIRVTLADGRALPSWLVLTGQGVLIGNPPAGLPYIDLRIQSMVDGNLLGDTLRIDLSSAVISEHVAEERRTDLGGVLFSQALRDDTEKRDLEIAALAAALAGEVAE